MNYTITHEQLEQLARIYNTLATVNTKGEDTIIMGQCLQATKELFEMVAKQVQEEIIEEEKE